MIFVYVITTVVSSEASSEASGYELANALDYESPWLMWRSTSTGAQTITLNYSGSIDSLALLGTNFENVNIKAGGWFAGDGWFADGWFEGGESSSETLGYLRLMNEYRGLIIFTSRDSKIVFEIPAQGTLGGESYFTMSAIIIGNKTIIARRPVSPMNKMLALPVSEITLESQIPKKAALGNKYHTINLNRKGMDISDLNEFRDIKRAVGKTDAFIFYENMNEKGKVFLVRRIEDFSYHKDDYHDFQDGMAMEEIA